MLVNYLPLKKTRNYRSYSSTGLLPNEWPAILLPAVRPKLIENYINVDVFTCSSGPLSVTQV